MLRGARGAPRSTVWERLLYLIMITLRVIVVQNAKLCLTQFAHEIKQSSFVSPVSFSSLSNTLQQSLCIFVCWNLWAIMSPK